MENEARGVKGGRSCLAVYGRRFYQEIARLRWAKVRAQAHKYPKGTTLHVIDRAERAERAAAAPSRSDDPSTAHSGSQGGHKR